MSFLGSIFGSLIERDGRKRTVAEWREELEKSALTVDGRLRGCTGADKDQETGRHVICWVSALGSSI